MKIHLLKVIIAMSKTLLHGVIITCLFTGLLLANDGNAQHKSIKEVHISLELTQATIPATLEKIQDKTDFKFVYEKDVITSTRDRLVTLKAVDQSVFKILKTISNETDLNFRQLDGNIVIKVPTPKKVVSSTKEEVLPARVISGKITEPNGEPLAGASILIKGTSRGAIADVDGNYALNAEDEDVLVFSFIGYTPFEVTVGNQSVIDVVLQEDRTNLGEVVVNAGYYTVKEREQTGNIVKVSAQEIEKQPIANPLQALQGRMTGVNIVQNSGVPGGGFTIRIRGQNSLRNDGNEPLYIIDGVPTTSNPIGSSLINQGIIGGGNPLSSINPADIESIEVLKDADATAIYGSRGANGVVLITTKKGKAGKTKIDINVYHGAGEVNQRLDLLNTQQYLEMRREAFANDGATPNTFNAPDLLVWDTTRYTDWQEEIFGGTANVTNAQASISGGTTNTQFLIGLGYYNETTVFPGDFGTRKISGHFNLNHISLNKKFKASFSLTYSNEDNDLPSNDITSFLTTAPNPSIYDENGDLNWENGVFNNPFSTFQQQYDANTDNLVTNGVLSYELIPGLEIKGNLGYTKMRIDENWILPKSSFNPAFRLASGFSYFGNNEFSSWVLEPQMGYNKKISKGELRVLIGATFQENIREGRTLIATGFNSDAMLENILAASTVTPSRVAFSQYNYNAIFGRINYNWDGKYIVNATARRDGSSRFGPGNQFANFGAIGAGWIFSEEGFIQSGLSSFLSYGKLRASYGSTGSDQIGDYQYLDSWGTVIGTYQGQSGVAPLRLFNPDFAWERTKKLEIGLDLGFIEDRIFLSTSYFKNRSSNQLVGIPLPPTAGFTTIQGNFPATVQNTGWEMELNTINIKTDHFSWSTAANITIPRNELIEFPDIENSQFNNIYVVGESLGIRNGFLGLGVDSETGIYIFDDVDDDGNVSSPNDLQLIGEIRQEYFGGLNNSFTWKGWQLDVFFQFVKQTGRDERTFSPPGFLNVNATKDVLDRWQNAGDVTDIQRFTQTFGSPFSAYFTHNVNSDASIVDASFIRLKNISVSYQVPSEITQRIHLQNIRLYVQGQNLITITDYEGLDPENQSLNVLPPLKMLTAGLQVTL